MGNSVHHTAFSEVQGRRWNLTQVKNKSTTINIDRPKAPINIYSITFEEAHLIGMGAGNFFSAAYTARQNHTLLIAGLCRICGDTLYETEKFTEYEYFRHLQRVNRWELHDGELDLHTCDEDGSDVVLIFF